MSEKDKKKIIGVVGACRGAGTTFTASLLAQAIAKKNESVAFLETNLCCCHSCMNKPLAFYVNGLYKQIIPGRFRDFFYMKFMGYRTDNRANIYKGVNWAVRNETSPCCLLLPEDVAGRYIIWDEPPIFEEYGYGRVSADKIDLILCVTRPEIQYMAAGRQTIGECAELWGTKFLLIYNMVASESSLKFAEKYIGKKGDFVIWNDLDKITENIEKIAEYIVTLY